MSKKYQKKYLKPNVFDPKNHCWVGVVWPVVGSTGNNYSVELTDNGFECDCKGFGWHGYCNIRVNNCQIWPNATTGDACLSCGREQVRLD